MKLLLLTLLILFSCTSGLGPHDEYCWDECEATYPGVVVEHAEWAGDDGFWDKTRCYCRVEGWTSLHMFDMYRKKGK